MDTCSPKECMQTVWCCGDAMSQTVHLVLDMKPVECQRAMSRQALTQTYMLSSSMLSLSASSGSQFGEGFRLPSLPRSTHGCTTTTPVSISESSLVKPRHWALSGEFSRNCCPSLLQRRTSSLPSCQTSENKAVPQQSYHHVYMHFCQPLRPISKVRKTCVQRQTTERRALQPLVKQPLNSETLSVRGKTCLPSQPLPTTASRKEVHIFLPAERAGEEDGKDSESVDEGFMDELDNKITTLTL